MRKKQSEEMQEALLMGRYMNIVDAIADADKALYFPEVKSLTGLNDGQIKAANKFGRRAFGRDNISITDYVLSGPFGLFLPRRGRDIVAYVAYNYKKISSELKTLQPIYDYAMEKYGEELLDEINRKDNSDVIDDEVIPWEIFNRIMNTDYRRI